MKYSDLSLCFLSLKVVVSGIKTGRKKKKKEFKVVAPVFFSFPKPKP